MASHPVTQAVRFLRTHEIAFAPYLYDYVEHGGTHHSAQCLGVAEHLIIKTIILVDEHKKGLVMLMFGDAQISTRTLARETGRRRIEPAKPSEAARMTGYLVGGTSPFGLKTSMSVYVQEGVMDLPDIWINGGKRGFLVRMSGQDLKVLNPHVVNAIQAA